eukprot:CAMPEP_0172449010 /NCGR_PEP_ID=MMETSP1065-20121228/7849_1 /TAXON_ID=265537 /ORGANISM="Amphiprora paludosa, Strain CCMP125" /LENGTH=174 /DNA_ID=CAMNT_0013200609 /DNA_START=64 /DNA_END=588 /DNA_ORIENTATION=+
MMQPEQQQQRRSTMDLPSPQTPLGTTHETARTSNAGNSSGKRSYETPPLEHLRQGPASLFLSPPPPKRSRHMAQQQSPSESQPQQGSPLNHHPHHAGAYFPLPLLPDCLDEEEAVVVLPRHRRTVAPSSSSIWFQPILPEVEQPARPWMLEPSRNPIPKFLFEEDAPSSSSTFW